MPDRRTVIRFLYRNSPHRDSAAGPVSVFRGRTGGPATLGELAEAMRKESEND